MHRRRSKGKTSAGFSLIEMLIAITLSGLLLGMVHSLFIYGATTFARNEKQTLLQQDIRFAARVISDAVRYARQLDILDAVPTTPSDTIYIFAKQGQIMRFSASGDNIIAALPEGTYNIEFHIPSVGKELKFTITGSFGQENYSLSSSVIGLNLENDLPVAHGDILRLQEVN
ncbi:MAG: prepilin-type N-terminal cleavage/methylation domain-containing protein [Firmicutes bacterium]|nr:prepilin-type N-terminal cleavage/methylation domain-containing protein [Bacillota bacterium]